MTIDDIKEYRRKERETNIAYVRATVQANTLFAWKTGSITSKQFTNPYMQRQQDLSKEQSLRLRALKEILGPFDRYSPLHRAMWNQPWEPQRVEETYQAWYDAQRRSFS